MPLRMDTPWRYRCPDEHHASLRRDGNGWSCYPCGKKLDRLYDMKRQRTVAV